MKKLIIITFIILSSCNITEEVTPRKERGITINTVQEVQATVCKEDGIEHYVGDPVSYH